MGSSEAKPILRQYGSIWLDGSVFGTQVPWPFATFEVFHDHFRVGAARFTDQNVVALEKTQWLLLSSGLRIIHTNKNCGMKRPIFWTFDFPSLQRALESIGFRVSA
jgi:hypothetical protein